MSHMTCVSPQPPDSSVVSLACSGCAAKRCLGGKVFNTEVDENVPEEAQVPAEAVASAGEEIPGEDVDEGVVNDSEGLPGELQDPEGAQFRVRPDPGEPTVSQIEDHRACGHWPYRSWCPECIKARGGCEQHRRRTEAKGISVFSFDYLFLDEAGNMIRREDVTENTAVALTILVAHDSKGKACFAHVVPQKGIDAEHYAVDALMRDVAWLGYTHISLRSDNEPAIVKLLQHALTEARYTVEDLEQILEEHPNTYDSSGNGQIEATVKQFTGILRTNKLDLEERLNKKIPLSSPLVTWLVEFAAFIITIRVKGDDGKTAHQRVRKCDFAKRLVPFGELVLVHLPIKSPERQNAGALDAHAKYGIILGYGRQRHSYQVFAEGAVKEYRTVHRLPLSKRWDTERLEEVNVTPKDLHEGRGSRAVPFTERDEAAADGQQPKRRVPRQLELRQADFDPLMGGFGWTEHCPKCSKARRYGWQMASNQQHSRGCRTRLEGLLAQTERGRRRLAHTKEKLDRWTAEQGPDGATLDAGSKEEMIVPTNPAAEPTDSVRVPAGVPPPPEARVGYKRMHEEDGESDRDVEFQVPGGEAAPVTPRRNEHDDGDAQDAPMEVEHLKALAVAEKDEDIAPVVDLVGEQSQEAEAIVQDSVEILKLIAGLGGSVRQYRRERAKAVKHLVAEIYSAPRVTRALKMLPSLGLSPGFALDLTGTDRDGRAWDFTLADMRERARQKVAEDKPFMLIGSPACTPYSTWQRLNAVRHGWPDGEVERRCVAGDVHLSFMCELYRMQLDHGRYFLHENPEHASSWQRSCIAELMKDQRVQRTAGDQCQYGQQSHHGDPVRKPTGWLSNSPELIKALSRRCSGRGGACSRRGGGRHVSVSGRVAREAAVYPFKLCRAILEGCTNQLMANGKMKAGMLGLQPQFEEDVVLYYDHATGALLEGEDAIAAEKVFAVQPQHHENFRDSVTGQPLRAELVRAARKLELEYFDAKQVWEKRPRSEALAKTGKAPITVRWIDTNKGDDEQPNYRSRLVAREIRRAGEDPIFAPTPPLESLRTIVSLAATDLKGMAPHVRDTLSERRTQVSFMDISRAYFCAATDPDDPTYVELPAEDPDSGTKVGLLRKHMYGTRAAAQGWHSEYAGRLVEDLGFSCGDASACIFYHRGRNLRCSVHGDDLTTVGAKADLDWFRSELEKLYELKEPHRIGPGPEDHKEALVLNRVVRWTAAGLEIEADPRQAEKLLRELKLDGHGVKAAASPGVRSTREQLDADLPLDKCKATPYRAVVARANYLAADRPELQFAAKEVCRWMASPTETSLNALKRLGRYVAGHRRLVFQYPWQTVDRVDTYSDTDWAGCPKTRKSTSGGCLMLGQHLIKSWSSTQASIALSSGEAEYYGVVKASGVSLGYQALLADVGLKIPIRVWTDSSATIGICGRQGLGRLRHIDTQCLWIQQRVRDGTVQLYKVRGEENPADLFTKHLTCQDRINNLLELFGCSHRDGRAEVAPKVRADAGTSKGELLRLEAAGVHLVDWDGHKFPTVEAEGEQVVEALQQRPGVLPHLHEDLEERFPRAKACEATVDEDPVEDGSLEHRGELLGRREHADHRRPTYEQSVAGRFTA